jgi:hypothetical protein
MYCFPQVVGFLQIFRFPVTGNIEILTGWAVASSLPCEGGGGSWGGGGGRGRGGGGGGGDERKNEH